MSEPEISRRCPSCGASIRDLAFFCPQCGNQLARQKSDPEPRPTSVVTAPLVEMSRERDGSNAELAPADQPTKPLDTEPEESKAEKPNSEKAVGQAQRIRGGNVALDKVRGQIQRATTLARDVEGDVIHRVQKVREISTVVLDEAGYDPSLRFVLVAAALFVLFLIIVLLNKFIG